MKQEDQRLMHSFNGISDSSGWTAQQQQI